MIYANASLESQRIQNEADRLLELLQVESFLRKFGAVEFEGAYVYELMAKRDIDVRVLNPSITIQDVEDVIAWAKALAGYRKHTIVDESAVNDRREGAPRGYYLGLHFNLNDHDWKIDVWFVIDPGDRSNYPESLRDPMWYKVLSEEQRSAIVRIKWELLHAQGDYTGANVYRSVLEANAQNIDEFRKWRIDN